MTGVPTRWYLPAGAARRGQFDLEITPESAGWDYTSLRVLTLPAGGGTSVDTADEEMFLVPLVGSATVTVSGESIDLEGRSTVFEGPTDIAYVPIRSRAAISTATGGRFALAGARTGTVLPFRYGPKSQVPVELRGSGQCSRLVRNFGTVEAFEAGAVIACEVVTPGGNWSSYPAHKHDQASETECRLEEIYYFQVAAGPAGQPGFGYHRTSASAAGHIDVLEEVRDGDAALVPHGWHGPCAAAPGFDMYYLNVMAGPAPDRTWLITDHPDQTWVRESWPDQPVDPRLTAS